MNKGIIAALLCLLASPSFAQEAFTPDVYSRMSITLIPKIEPKPIPAPLPKPLPLPKQPAEETEPKGKLHTKAEEKEKEKKKEEMKAIRVGDPVEEERPLALPPRTPITYNVEVKTPDFLTQEDFITHSDFAEHEGLLILIEPVGVATVNATLMLSAADVLFINEDGFITKIAPNLNLAELSEPIPSGRPVRALLFIKANGTQADRLVPGDRFEGAIFKTHPLVIQ